MRRSILRKLLLGLALTSALLACAPSIAQSANGVTMTAREFAPPSPILPSWTLSISGQWPTQCLPTLQSVTLNGDDLSIDARSVLDLCEQHSTPFSIEVNPTLALQRMVLPPSVYKVSFYAADGAQAQPRLRAFALVDRSAPGTPAIDPEAGFWWSTGSDHSLFSLELQGGQLSVAMLSYDNAGQPAWSFGAAPYDGRVAHVALLRLAGGSNAFSAAATIPRGDAAMMLDLQFDASARAQAWLSQTRSEDGSLLLRRIELTRLPLTENADGSAWQGDWVFVSDVANAFPQRLRLDRFQASDAGNFQLATADGAIRLDCERGDATLGWPPQTCSLRLADGTVSRFDSVAIARMDGTDANGATVHLLRVTP